MWLVWEPMEWMLQVVDELDDVVGTARHLWVGARRNIAIVAAGIAGAAALLGLIALSAAPFLICCSVVLLSAALALLIQRRVLRIASR
jgi:hypothetical protein